MSKDRPRREPKKPRTRARGEWCRNATPAEARWTESPVRCPECGRRLHLRANYGADGERVGFELPPHKTSTVK